MNRTRFLMLLSAAFCAGSVTLFGCMGSPSDTNDDALFEAKSKSSSGPALMELVYTGVATITGTITYDGEPPARGGLPGLDGHADRSYCMRGDVQDPTWMVEPATKGVENVVVWVTPPKGTYFKKPDDAQKTWTDEVVVDQPFCQFIPHVVVLYPQYYDGTSHVATGQTLKVLNSAEIGHNIKIAGSGDKNPARGSTLPAKTGQQIFADIRLESNRPIAMNCDIHKWMTGYALTFDHPYAARSEKGKFTIKNVPAGVDLSFRAWHEDLKQFAPAGDGPIKLAPGETKEINFTVKKK